MEEVGKLFCADCNKVTTWRAVWPGGQKKLRCDECKKEIGALASLELPSHPRDGILRVGKP